MTIKIKTKTKNTGSIASKIRKVSESNSIGPLKVVVYGRSGTGKTTFSGTFPKPLLHIVCSSLGLNESIPLLKLNDVYDFLLEDSSEINEITGYVSENNIKTVVLDHVTGLQDLIFKEILNLDDIPAQKNSGMATQAQWGQLGFQMKEGLRVLFMLPVNVVVIGQEREITVDEVTGLLTPYVSTAVTPSVGSWLHAAADIIIHTYIKPKTMKVKTKVGNSEVEIEKPTSGYSFCAHVAPNPVFVTKVRTSDIRELPEYIENPSYESLINIIK